MRVGVSTIDITPPVGIWMSGYGGRAGAETVHDPLWLQAVAVEGDGGEVALWFAADLLGFDLQFVQAARAALTAQCGVPAEAILLSGSHTHAGPAFINHFATEVPHLDAGYRQRVFDAVLTAATAALADRQEVDLHYGLGRCRVGINRRQPSPPYSMVPNPAGFYDDTVGVLAFCEPGTLTPRVVVFNATCHPTTLGSQTILSADWPGAARRALQAWLGEGRTAVFLQGCCGNIRPRTVAPGGSGFKQGTPADFERMGQACAHEVIRVLMDALQPAAGTLRFAAKALELPLEEIGDLETYRQSSELYTRAFADYAAERWPDGVLPTAVPYEVQQFVLGEAVGVVALPGEVVSEIGAGVRQVTGRPTLVAAYSNGSPAYIPSARIRHQGGYEGGQRNLQIYGWPGGLAPDCERLILDAAAGLNGEFRSGG
ncbi:MAG: hypothetical protein IT204_19470 [Fimbriimonadaceae bacterium]|nr:hypothetical protein [Fimbriimonadaceae bacterium]